MPKFDVHVYANVRLKVKGIEAESHEKAIDQVEDMDFHEIFDNDHPIEGEHVEWAEETLGFLVDGLDDQGDLVDKNSWWFNSDKVHELMRRCLECGYTCNDPVRPRKRGGTFCPLCLGHMVVAD